MPIFTDFISAFLTRMEERHCVAYIPCKRRNFDGHGNAGDCGEPVGQSGVTIGAGLDLGQQGEADLRRMGLEMELINLFRPYLGKKRARRRGRPGQVPPDHHRITVRRREPRRAYRLYPPGRRPL